MAATAAKMNKSCTVAELKASLEALDAHGIALDIDETLAATNVAWFERCVQLFGTHPDDVSLSVQQLIEKYHLAQYNPHWQNNPKARAWMHEQRNAPEAQDGLPLIPGALEGVQQLQTTGRKKKVFVAYLTVRPDSVNSNTITWLHESGFPTDIPVVAKPGSIPFEDGNQWKAQALHSLWPQVTGIVDDNPKVPRFAGSNYKGHIYLFGKSKVEPDHAWAIPCRTWPDVVKAIQQKSEER